MNDNVKQTMTLDELSKVILGAEAMTELDRDALADQIGRGKQDIGYLAGTLELARSELRRHDRLICEAESRLIEMVEHV